MKCEFGVYGLGVMGASLALNLERNGTPVAVYNYTYDLTEKLLSGEGVGKRIQGCRTVYEFVATLERPRRILVMVTAGGVVDDVIAHLRAHLDPGDILIDGGNSHYSDTEQRQRDLHGSGIEFIGMGVSGGQQGALWGPSLMPGGDEGTYRYIAPTLQRIAAKARDGLPCVAYMGNRGAGHFVKMVHNGIEYGDMQLICEAYDFLRYGMGLTPDEVSETFERWNEGELSSYLIEITSKITNRADDLTDEGTLLDQIRDRAGMKGTGTWTGTTALDLGEPIPTIIAAQHARGLSSLDEERRLARETYDSSVKTKTLDAKERDDWIDKIKDAMYASKVCSYAQGFSLLRRASQVHKYGLNMATIASIWRGGCIIRADFLDQIRTVFAENAELATLLVAEPFHGNIVSRVDSWRETVAQGSRLGLPVPAMSASLSYFESLRRDRLPANLIQAQRDFFGAHTYQRTDREGIFHTEWE
jgi:6-phosphogluconate dehydrogenase